MSVLRGVRMRCRSALVWVTAAGLVGSAAATAPHWSTPRSRPALPLPASALHRFDSHPLRMPPSTAECMTTYRLACYSAPQIRAAYGVPPLLSKGNDGAGRTIAIVDSFGSPTIEQDLRVFDRTWGLPDPPSITTITPAGPLPPFDPAAPEMTGWAFETTLDVE